MHKFDGFLVIHIDAYFIFFNLLNSENINIIVLYNITIQLSIFKFVHHWRHTSRFVFKSFMPKMYTQNIGTFIP